MTACVSSDGRAAVVLATMAQLLPWLRLVRAGTLFSPGCDVVAGLCIVGGLRFPSGNTVPFETGVAIRAIAASIAVYAAGMVWNDVADRAEDARQRPERPIPRGDVSLTGAIALGSALVAAAIALSPCPAHHALLAGLALAYDFLLKKVRLLGALTMGTLRGLNLGTAAFVPVWWIGISELDGAGGTQAPGMSTPLLIAAVCYGVYIVAVTILGILEDEPHARTRAVVAVQTIPPLAALAGMTAVQRGPWPAPALAAVPIAWFAIRLLRVATWDQRAIRRSMMFLLLGTMLYTSLLCVAADEWLAAAAIAACIAPARLIARRIALT